MIMLYGVPRSRTMRPLWMLEELGVPYENKPVSFLGESRSPEFLRLNPNGHIPVLRDDDVVIWESMAINLYLARKYGKGLWPRTVEDVHGRHHLLRRVHPDAPAAARRDRGRQAGGPREGGRGLGRGQRDDGGGGGRRLPARHRPPQRRRGLLRLHLLSLPGEAGGGDHRQGARPPPRRPDRGRRGLAPGGDERPPR